MRAGPRSSRSGLSRSALDQRLHGGQRLHVRRDDGLLGDEESEIGGLEVVRVRRRLAEAHDARDDDEEAGVLLRLHPALRAASVLDGERMEVKDVGEERGLGLIGDVEVHPERGAVGMLERGANRLDGEVTVHLTVRAAQDTLHGDWEGSVESARETSAGECAEYATVPRSRQDDGHDRQRGTRLDPLTCTFSIQESSMAERDKNIKRPSPSKSRPASRRRAERLAGAEDRRLA